MRPFKTKLANVVPAVDHVLVDIRKAATAFKEVNVATRDAMMASNSAAHRAVSAGRLVAMMLRAMLNKVRAVTQTEVRPVTVKARRADELDTDKARRGIGADTLRIKVETSRADIHHGDHTVVRVEPMAISVRHVVIKTIKTLMLPNPSPPTMTSVEVVGASSRTTLRSRHSISGPRVRLDRLEHVRLVLPVANVPNVAAMIPTMRLRSRDRRGAIRLNAVRIAARVVTDRRVIANCRLAAEASGRLRPLVR